MPQHPCENGHRPEIDRASGPVRFVWRTDAEGKFSHISPEFSRAVGAEAADIVGRRFEDVADVLGLDPAGEIAGLLARRDTWSGRSVLWPIAGTDLKIPVDLAALPVYDRARTFEGFRGFGVARTGDAVVDPEGHRAGAGRGSSRKPRKMFRLPKRRKMNRKRRCAKSPPIRSGAKCRR